MEAENGSAVLKLVEKETYGVIVLDISMPGISGLDVLKQLKKRKNCVPVPTAT